MLVSLANGSTRGGVCFYVGVLEVIPLDFKLVMTNIAMEKKHSFEER